MAAKDFTPRQVEVLIQGCEMVVASFQRRVNAEKDAETRAVWQKKIDEANVLLSKMRSA